MFPFEPVSVAANQPKSAGKVPRLSMDRVQPAVVECVRLECNVSAGQLRQYNADLINCLVAKTRTTIVGASTLWRGKPSSLWG
jgi:hypothetical protein